MTRNLHVFSMPSSIDSCLKIPVFFSPISGLRFHKGFPAINSLGYTTLRSKAKAPNQRFQPFCLFSLPTYKITFVSLGIFHLSSCEKFSEGISKLIYYVQHQSYSFEAVNPIIFRLI